MENKIQIENMEGGKGRVDKLLGQNSLSSLHFQHFSKIIVEFWETLPSALTSQPSVNTDFLQRKGNSFYKRKEGNI